MRVIVLMFSPWEKTCLLWLPRGRTSHDHQKGDARTMPGRAEGQGACPGLRQVHDLLAKREGPSPHVKPTTGRSGWESARLATRPGSSSRKLLEGQYLAFSSRTRKGVLS